MIFPILRGFIHPLQAPVTYLLLFINLLVHFSTLEVYLTADHRMNEILKDEAFLETQGAAFALMIHQESLTDREKFSPTLRAMAEKAMRAEDCGGGQSEMSCRKLLGGLAIRNPEFMAKANSQNFKGDEIALINWKEKFEEFKSLQDEHPSYIWGISQSRPGYLQWISYQFSHSGWLHLFWNMIFLLIFGAFIETRVGSSFVALAYVGGGLAGAFVFAGLSGISASPLVGASGAVSALIGLVAFGWMKREGLRYFYWLLPIQGYYGFVFLPSWLVLIVSVVPDVSGYLSSSRDIGSVAYTAHIGGVVWGAVLAGLLIYGILVKEIDEAKEEDGKDEINWPPDRKAS